MDHQTRKIRPLITMPTSTILAILKHHLKRMNRGYSSCMMTQLTTPGCCTQLPHMALQRHEPLASASGAAPHPIDGHSGCSLEVLRSNHGNPGNNHGNGGNLHMSHLTELRGGIHVRYSSDAKQ